MTSLLCAVGASTWIILSEQTAKPSTFTALNTTIDTTNVSATKIYYGENSTITGLVVKDSNGLDVTSFFNQVTPSTKALKGTGTAEDSVSGSVNVSFTLKDEYKNVYNVPTAVSVSVPMYAVASYNNSTYYSTVDQALAAANSKNTGTVYALPLGELATTKAYELDTGRAKAAKTIGITNTTTTTTEINSGVTFRLPFTTVDDTKTTSTDNTETIDTEVVHILYNVYQKNASAYGVAKYLQNQVFVKDNYTLTNYGTLTIAGQVSGGNATDSLSSMTAGNHAQLNLGKNTTLNNGLDTTAGTIRCYGYINDNSGNNTAKMNANRGKVTIVFSVVEHRGGAFYFGMILTDPTNPNKYSQTEIDKIADKVADGITAGDAGADYNPETLLCHPFNRFYMESINCKLTAYYNSNIVGHANLYANNQQNSTDLPLINSNTALITLTNENSYVENQFDPQQKVHDLNIFGDMKLNPFTLTLKISASKDIVITTINTTVNVNLSTGNILFALSYHFNITLNPFKNGTNSTADLQDQKIKLLPGANLTIEKGVTVNAKAIAIYQEDDYSLLNNVGATSQYYATNKQDAQLTVKGTLNVDNLGGEVKTSGSGAILNIGKNSLVSKEMSGQSPQTKVSITISYMGQTVTEDLPYTAVHYYTDEECTFTANGKTLTKDNDTLTTGTYYSQNGAWYSPEFTITYDTNGGTAVGAETVNLTEPGGYTFTNDNLPDTTRKHYTFSHWCTKDNCTNGSDCANKALNKTIYGDTTIYATWKMNSYTIQYSVGNDVSADEYPDFTPTTPDSVTILPTGNTTATLPVLTPTDVFFNGWYLNNKLEPSDKLDDTISIDDIEANLTTGKYVLTTVTNADGSKSITVTLYGEYFSGYEIKLFINDTTVQSQLGNTTADGLFRNAKTTIDTETGIISISDADWNSLNAATYDNPYVSKIFVGWYIDDETEFTKDTAITESMSLYAKWAEEIETDGVTIKKQVLSFTTPNADEGLPEIIIDSVYLLPDQEYNLTTANSHLAKLDDNDETVTVTKYFGGWSLVSGTATLAEDSSSIIIESETVIQVVWTDKYVLSFNTTTNNGNVSVALTEVYLIDGQEFDLTTANEYLASLDDFDNAVAYDRYFNGWVDITASTITVDTDTTITVNWANKSSLIYTNTAGETVSTEYYKPGATATLNNHSYKDESYSFAPNNGTAVYTGYTASYWYIAAPFENIETYTFSPTTVENITLKPDFVKYTEEYYMVTISTSNTRSIKVTATTGTMRENSTSGTILSEVKSATSFYVKKNTSLNIYGQSSKLGYSVLGIYTKNSKIEISCSTGEYDSNNTADGYADMNLPINNITSAITVTIAGSNY